MCFLQLCVCACARACMCVCVKLEVIQAYLFEEYFKLLMKGCELGERSPELKFKDQSVISKHDISSNKNPFMKVIGGIIDCQCSVWKYIYLKA